MTQSVQTQGSPVGSFPNLQAAEAALNALKEANFSTEQFSVVPGAPPLADTKAKTNAKAGAITGTVLGGLVGFILGFIALGAGIPGFDPVPSLLGLVLAGSGVGAASMSLAAAMTGVNVRKDDEAAAIAQTI